MVNTIKIDNVEYIRKDDLESELASRKVSEEADMALRAGYNSAYEIAKNQGVTEERARIVAWLLIEEHPFAAEAIESGEYLKELEGSQECIDRPGHLRTCGTAYRGCDPKCPKEIRESKDGSDG